MVYLLQINCYAALLFGIYLLLLKNRVAHSWSRAYLLVCAVLPLALPFIQLPGLHGSLLAATGSYQLSLSAINISSTAAKVTAASWAALLYAAVAAILLGRVIAQYLFMRRFVTGHEQYIMQNARVLVNTSAGPGSFGPYIFLPGSDIDPAIFEHERAHIKLRHSADIVLLRLLQVCFWPNLMLYAISRELRLVHEFQADAFAAGNRDSYIATLLNNTFQTNRFQLSHTFFHHPLKRRIMMLHKSSLTRTGKRSMALRTLGAAALLLTGIIWLQSCKPTTEDIIKNAGDPPASQVIKTDDPERTTGGKEIYKFADKPPKPSYDLSQYLSDNIKYPGSAKKAKISGKVIIKFVVDEEGNVRDAQAIKQADPALTAEALRVVSSMPRWIPGENKGKKVSVYFHLPVVFRLD